MGESKDFVIKNGVLEAYKGSDAQIQIPEGVTKIVGKNVGVFAYNETITSVKFPEGLQEIGAHAFHGCSKLKSIELPESVRSIGERAFAECKALDDVKLPAGLEFIGFCAFSQCGKKMRSIRIPKSLSKPLDAYVAGDSVLVIPEVRFSDEKELYKSIYLRGSLQTGNAKLLTIGTDDAVARRVVLNNECRYQFDADGNFDWVHYDMHLAENTSKLKLGAIFRTLAMAYRLRYDNDLADNIRRQFTDHVFDNIRKIAPYINILPEDGLVKMLEDLGAINEENRKVLLPLMGVTVPKEKKPAKAPKKKENGDEESQKEGPQRCAAEKRMEHQETAGRNPSPEFL